MLLFKGSDKMKKPEKKGGRFTAGGLCFTERAVGYNQACDDWERWLFSGFDTVDNLAEFLFTLYDGNVATHKVWEEAKAIHERIKGW